MVLGLLLIVSVCRWYYQPPPVQGRQCRAVLLRYYHMYGRPRRLVGMEQDAPRRTMVLGEGMVVVVFLIVASIVSYDGDASVGEGAVPPHTVVYLWCGGPVVCCFVGDDGRRRKMPLLRIRLLRRSFGCWVPAAVMASTEQTRVHRLAR